MFGHACVRARTKIGRNTPDGTWGSDTAFAIPPSGWTREMTASIIEYQQSNECRWKGSGGPWRIWNAAMYKRSHPQVRILWVDCEGRKPDGLLSLSIVLGVLVFGPSAL